MLSRKTTDLGVGLFVLIGVCALLFLAFKSSNLGQSLSDNTYQIFANFDNVGTLKVRAPVKSAGVAIGRVADIRFDQENLNARVTLEISASYRLPDDTTALIMTSGLLGEQFISIEYGIETSLIPPGGKIHQVQSALSIEKLISKFLFENPSK